MKFLTGDFNHTMDDITKSDQKDAEDPDKDEKLTRPQAKLNKDAPKAKPPKIPAHMAKKEEKKEEKKLDKKMDRKLKKEENKKKDTGGWTFPFITDSILNELDVMKRRYLKKFWGTTDEDVAYKEKDLRLEKGEQHDIADDIAVIGDTGPIDHSHNHGSTEQETTSGENPKKDL